MVRQFALRVNCMGKSHVRFRILKWVTSVTLVLQKIGNFSIWDQVIGAVVCKLLLWFIKRLRLNSSLAIFPPELHIIIDEAYALPTRESLCVERVPPCADPFAPIRSRRSVRADPFAPIRSHRSVHADPPSVTSCALLLLPFTIPIYFEIFQNS